MFLIFQQCFDVASTKHHLSKFHKAITTMHVMHTVNLRLTYFLSYFLFLQTLFCYNTPKWMHSQPSKKIGIAKLNVTYMSSIKQVT